MKTLRDWVLYVMVADAGGTRRHFKIGISSDLDGRLPSVQTGCPVPITSIMCVQVPGPVSARDIERRIHEGLAGYRSSGEWFLFNLASPDHKAAFNGVVKAAMRYHCGDIEWKWTIHNIAKVKRRIARENAETRNAHHQQRNLGVARMAVSGYRFLTCV